MPELPLISVSEFQRVRGAQCDELRRLAVLADMLRANALTLVKLAGSGHLGASFSAADIVTWLYHHELNVAQVGLTDPARDIYISSKGHDAPGLYTALFSLGVLPYERYIRLRRLGGVDGHPDVGVPGVEANSGSLGMGISKGRGLAWAKRYRKLGGRVVVLTGDGELQEGQNYEALQGAAADRLGALTVIVDHNKVQSDRLVDEIMPLGDLVAKLGAFGWHVTRCDGHDFAALQRTFAELATISDRPKVLIADTVKGRGVSFMEHPRALRDNNGYYKWHAGAPEDAAFVAAHQELAERLRAACGELGLAPVAFEHVEPFTERQPRNALGEPVSAGAVATAPSLKESAEYVVEAYGTALLERAQHRDDVIVVDADLAADCRVRPLELRLPAQFVETGIAEQDMVSMAGGIARLGLLPVVNSFATFLASRANEQIYNNATEKTKIIYACHYGGLIPAGPGKSHQSLRDISLFGALPNVTIVQPGTPEETKQVVRYCVDEARESCMIRLAIGPCPRRIELPADYSLQLGRGTVLADGADAIVFAYGPVMLAEALGAHELARRTLGIRVVNMPWLNRCDVAWLTAQVAPYRKVFVIDDHAPVGGLADFLLATLASAGQLRERDLVKLAVEGFPACGTPAEALRAHRLDAASLVERIAEACAAVRPPG